MTLRARVALLTTVVVALAFALTGTAIVSSTERAQQRRLEQQLDERLDSLVGAVGGGAGRPFGPRPGPLGGRLEALRQVAERTLGRGFFVVVRDDDGDVAVTLGDVPEDLPDTGDVGAEGATLTAADGTRYLVRRTQRPAGALTLLIGVDVQDVLGADQQALRSRFLLLGAGATVLAGLVTFLLTGLATRPLRQLREATGRVAATEDLTTRVDTAGAPAEVAAVADGLNTMLARLEGSMQAREAALHAARRFAADAGHELRTPLTAMQSTLDTLGRNPDLDGPLREEMVAEVAEETRRLSGLLDALQSLARADAGLPAAMEPVDLAELVAEACGAMAQRHPTVRFAAEGAAAADGGRVEVAGAAPWLRSVVDNLLRNAAVHGRPDGRVVATVQAADGWARLLVDDDGPGIPPDERESVFERFTRGADATSRPGSGLGLALVAQLAAIHGGTVSVADSPLGGARLEVLLPLRAPQVPPDQPLSAPTRSRAWRRPASSSVASPPNAPSSGPTT